MRATPLICAALLISAGFVTALGCGDREVYSTTFTSPEATSRLRLLFQAVDAEDEEAGLRAAWKVCRLPQDDQLRIEAFWGRFSERPRLARRLGHASLANMLEPGHPAREAFATFAREHQQDDQSVLGEDAPLAPPTDAEPAEGLEDIDFGMGLATQPERALRWYQRALKGTDQREDYVLAAELRCDLTRVLEVQGELDAAFDLAAARMDARPLPAPTQARREAAIQRITRATQS